MYHKDAYKTLVEKACQEIGALLNKSWMQHTTKQKVLSLSLHISKKIFKTKKTCEKLLIKQGRTHVTFFYGSLSHVYASVC